MVSDEPGELRWRDGRLTGTTTALSDLSEFRRDNDHAGVTPTGPFLPIDLTDPLSAFVVAVNLFRSPQVSGRTPDLPDTSVPDAAIP